MNKNFKKTIYSALVFGVVLSAATVYARPGEPLCGDPEARRARMESRMEAIQERLGLSEEQQELLEAHRTKQREAAQSLGESIQSSRELLRAELTKEDLNMEDIDRLQAELKDLHARMADDRLEGMLEVRDILTPEQFAQFLELKGGWGPKKRMRHGPTDRDGQ